MTARTVCAVIATYRPDSQALQRVVDAIDGKVGRIAVVDDGSGDRAPGPIRGRISAVDVLRQPCNRGIAAAHNRGIEFARRAACSHVLLLDQDSVPEAGMIECLGDAMERLQGSGIRVAAVGARFRASETATASQFTVIGGIAVRRVACRSDADLIRTDFLLASGTLIPLSVLDDVGGMEEPLFIDHVDTEWCLRAKSRGYSLFGACGAMLHHQWGISSRRVWLGRWRTIHRHKPFRYYYMFRNTLLLLGRPYAPLRWVLYEIWRLCGLLVFVGLLGGGIGTDLPMMLKGLAHGIRRITGRLEAPRP